ncbi:MAG TPA: tetratricopeptide repeat protein [Herpetosiphonaceae bacterium]
MTDLVRPLGHALQAIEVLLRLGQLSAAQTALDAVARSHPDLVALHILRGWLWLSQSQPERAVAAFRLAAGRDPTDALAWHGIAESSPDRAEQAAAAERAQMLSPQGPQAHLWHDLHSGKPHLAITALRALSRRFGERAEWAIWCAEAQRRVGNEQQARELIEPLLRRRPRPAPALFVAAALAQDGAQAYQYLLHALAVDPLATSAQRIFAPDAPPFQMPAPPIVAIPHDLAAALDALVPAAAPRPPRPGPQPMQPKAAQNDAAVPTTSTIDPESAAALRAVEQATERLLGRRSPQVAADQTTALLVTHYGALEASYGAETATAIVDTLASYGAALAQRGIQAACLLVDRQDTLAPLGNVAPAAERSAAACKDVIDAVCAHLKADGREVDAVVLLGGDGIIPFHRLPNPSQDADADVPSDNPYGCGAGSELAPELIVARFPDGGADGGRLLLDQLQRAIEYHRHWHIAGPRGVLTLPFMRRLTRALEAGGPVVSWGVSAEAWQLPSQTVYAELESARQLVWCPPATPDTIEAAWPGDGRLLYFNLHGLAGGPNWYGQAVGGPASAPLPVALTPHDIGSVPPAMICISEACYGAEIIGRTPSNAIALRLLQSGALAFVGSTATAYGAVTLPLGGADLLTQQTLQNLRRGHPLGRAVALARDWMAREVVQQQGYLDPDDAKTLLSFVLLGDPWATPYTRPVLERKAALPRIAPVVVQRRPVAVNLIAPAAVSVAQQLIAKVAPSLARAPLSAVGQGRPDRIAKGQASAVVFSATESLPTIDGRSIAQIARVTVAGGEARKLLLSR